MRKSINATLLIGYCGVIYWLSSKSSLSTPALFMHQDKVHHMGAYFLMGILAWQFFKDFNRQQKTIITVSLLFCSLYGASDEWHQSFVSGRDASVFDWAADTLGATLALFTMTLKRPFRQTN